MAIDPGVSPELVVRYVMDRWDDWKKTRKVRELIWMDCVKQYHRDSAGKVWYDYAVDHGYSARSFPAAWDAAENLTATISSQIFDDPQWLDVQPEAYQEGGPEYDDDAAELVRQALKYWFYRGNSRRAVKQAIKQLVLLGNSPWTVKWQVQRSADYPAYDRANREYNARSQAMWQQFLVEYAQWQQIAQAAAKSGQPPPPPQFKAPPPPSVNPRIAYEGPTIVCDDLFNFLIDPYPVADSTPLRLRRTAIPLAWLVRQAQPDPRTGYTVYDGLEDVHDTDLRANDSSADAYTAERAQLMGFDLPVRNGVELIEAQGDMVIPMENAPGGQIFMSYIATVANRSKLIRWEPTYLWTGAVPTQLSTLIDIPGCSYGAGLIEAGVDIADLLSKRMNQIVDAVDCVIFPEYKMYADGEIDPLSKTGPGKKHLVGDMANLEILAKDITGVRAGMEEMNLILRWYQQVTRSANPYVDTNSESTATEVNRNETLKSASFNDIVQNIEDGLIAPAMGLLVENIAAFTEGSAWAMIEQKGAGTKWQPISPELLRRGWLVRSVATRRVVDRQRQIQNVLMMLEMVSGNPLIMQSGMVDIQEMLKLCWGLMDLPAKDKVFTGGLPPAIMALQQFLAQQGATPNAPTEVPPGLPGGGAQPDIGQLQALAGLLGGGAAIAPDGQGGTAAPAQTGRNGEQARAA